MRCRWFIFQQRCDTDYFLERLNIAIIAIIFLDHRERLFFDYFANFEDQLFCDYSRFARSARSGQIETISTLNSVVNLQNVKHSYPYIKFLQLNCYLSAANRTGIENLLPSPKRDGFGGQHHHRCDYLFKPSRPIILRCFLRQPIIAKDYFTIITIIGPTINRGDASLKSTPISDFL